MVAVVGADGITCVLAVAQSTACAQEPADVVIAQTDTTVFDTDALAWSRLGGNGHLIVNQTLLEVHVYSARYAEQYRSRSRAVGQCPAQCTLAAVILQRADIYHLATTTTTGKASVAFRTRKSQMTRLETPHITHGQGAVGFFTVDTPVVGVHTAQVLHIIAILRGQCG